MNDLQQQDEIHVIFHLKIIKAPEIKTDKEIYYPNDIIENKGIKLLVTPPGGF